MTGRRQTPRTEAGPIRVPLKPCCGEVLDGEDCSCAEMAAQMASAPLVVIRRRR